MDRKQRIDDLLLRSEGGEDSPEARDELFDFVYGELRSIAGSLLNAERPGHTLQPTALVHEAYIRLGDSRHLPWKNRSHFFFSVSRAMRRVLVDHARRRSSQKRGGAMRPITLEYNHGVCEDNTLDVIDLDRILTKMQKLDSRMAKVVELHTLIGLKMDDVARVLGVSTRTAAGDWSVAKKWMRLQLTPESE